MQSLRDTLLLPLNNDADPKGKMSRRSKHEIQQKADHHSGAIDESSIEKNRKNRKRKRSTTRDDGPSASKKAARAVKGKGGKGRKPEGTTKKKGAADGKV